VLHSKLNHPQVEWLLLEEGSLLEGVWQVPGLAAGALQVMLERRQVVLA
jgi:hypothetical protein